MCVATKFSMLPGKVALYGGSCRSLRAGMYARILSTSAEVLAQQRVRLIQRALAQQRVAVRGSRPGVATTRWIALLSFLPPEEPCFSLKISSSSSVPPVVHST